MSAVGYFTPATFQFLDELMRNNERTWFAAHQEDYEQQVREPSLAFIADMAPVMQRIAPHFPALAKKVGGSLMRVQKDTRFARDKTPYKTNIGIQFRHNLGKDIHAPGYYLHVAVDDCFIGAGLWHPEANALSSIRTAIDTNAKDWLKVRDDRGFRRHFTLSGDSLSAPPRGFAKNHPLLEDLQRKDFVGLTPLTADELCAPNLLHLVEQRFAAAEPLMRFLCKAVGVNF